jgi:hypothetical protein
MIIGSMTSIKESIKKGGTDKYAKNQNTRLAVSNPKVLNKNKFLSH